MRCTTSALWHVHPVPILMDWTGGARRRFAGRKNNIIAQKQKAHFAKVREGLGSTTDSQRSFHPDFLQGTIVQKKQIAPREDLDRIEHTPLHSENGRKKTLPCRRAPSEIKESYRDANEHPAWHRHAREDQSARVDGDVGCHENPNSRNSCSTTLDPLIRSPSPADRMTAVRKRLLAKDDWLGLRAKRPLQYRFNPHSDKDRIGKRRKISRQNSTQRPNREYVLSPLFAERFVRPEYVMSGGLPDHQIKVRIGTDALASQTQVSRRSRTPGKTSLRAPSTDLDRLSDPMLLGSDGDIFESGRFAKAVENQIADDQDGEMAQVHSLHGVNFDGYAAQDVVQQLPMELAPDITAYDNQEYHDDWQYGEPNSWSSALTLEQFDTPFHLPESHIEKTVVEAQIVRETSPSDPDSSRFVHEDSDDDHIWRNLMALQQNASNHESVLALRSSSKHSTGSDSNYPPATEKTHKLSDDIQFSTPHGVGTLQSSSILAKQPVEYKSYIDESLSLGTIDRAADQGHETARVDEPERHHSSDNQLWRTFVGLGRSSDSISVHDLIECRQSSSTFEMIDEPRPPAASPMLSISGLGTSDMATMGGSTQVRTELRPPASDLSWMASDHTDPSLTRASRGSASRSAYDDIEETTSDAVIHQTSPTRAPSKLNVRRFKAPTCGAHAVADGVCAYDIVLRRQDETRRGFRMPIYTAEPMRETDGRGVETRKGTGQGCRGPGMCRVHSKTEKMPAARDWAGRWSSSSSPHSICCRISRHIHRVLKENTTADQDRTNKKNRSDRSGTRSTNVDHPKLVEQSTRLKVEFREADRPVATDSADRNPRNTKVRLLLHGPRTTDHFHFHHPSPHDRLIVASHELRLLSPTSLLLPRVIHQHREPHSLASAVSHLHLSHHHNTSFSFQLHPTDLRLQHSTRIPLAADKTPLTQRTMPSLWPLLVWGLPLVSLCTALPQQEQNNEAQEWAQLRDELPSDCLTATLATAYQDDVEDAQTALEAVHSEAVVFPGELDLLKKQKRQVVNTTSTTEVETSTTAVIVTDSSTTSASLSTSTSTTISPVSSTEGQSTTSASAAPESITSSSVVVVSSTTSDQSTTSVVISSSTVQGTQSDGSNSSSSSSSGVVLGVSTDTSSTTAEPQSSTVADSSSAGSTTTAQSTSTTPVPTTSSTSLTSDESTTPSLTQSSAVSSSQQGQTSPAGVSSSTPIASLFATTSATSAATSTTSTSSTDPPTSTLPSSGSAVVLTTSADPTSTTVPSSSSLLTGTTTPLSTTDSSGNTIVSSVVADSTAAASTSSRATSTATGVLVPVVVSSTDSSGSVAVTTTSAFQSTAPTSVVVAVTTTNGQGNAVTTSTSVPAAVVTSTNDQGSTVTTASPVASVEVGAGGSLITSAAAAGATSSPDVVMTTTDSDGGSFVITASSSGQVVTGTDSAGRTVVFTYTPSGGQIAETVLQTTTGAGGEVVTYTSFAVVGGETPTATTDAAPSDATDGSAMLQHGLAAPTGRYAAEIAVLIGGAIGIAALL
nr:hypothetical protein CFP56_44421 [Quercus suber]